MPWLLQAQDLVLSSNLTITQAQIDELYKQLPRTTEDRTFYHWTSKSTALRWISQKHISEGEISFLNTPSTDNQAFGPGFYIAERSTSSKRFGEVPVSLIIKKNSVLFDQKVVTKFLGRELTNDEASKLGNRIPFIRNVTDDWFVLNSSQHTKDIFYGAYSAPDVRVYVDEAESWSPFKFSENFSELINRGDQDALYLKRILVASDYMDGLSFARAMKINPGAPWTEFEPEGFSQYERALDDISKNLKEIQEIRFDGGTKKVILDVHNRIIESSHSDLMEAYRVEGIRAGGDEKGKTFLATEEHLKNLQSNPYLEVQFIPDGNGRYYVNYFYPDAFHFKKLKNVISPDLFEELSKTNVDDLMKNHERRHSLNKRIISELVDDFITKMNDGVASWKDLISIHPFNDKNGRTVRMLQKIFVSNLSHIALSDIDLLIPFDEQILYWQSSTSAHQNLQIKFLEEFLKAKTERRTPNYLKTGALDSYVNEVFPTPVKIDLNSQNDLEQIRNRQWTSLIEEGKPEGIKELERQLNNSSTKEEAVKRLINYTESNRVPYYSKEELLKLSSLLTEKIQDPKIETMNKVKMFFNYEKGLLALDDKSKVILADPADLKSQLMTDMFKEFYAQKDEFEKSRKLALLSSIERDHFKLINQLMDEYAISKDVLLADEILNQTVFFTSYPFYRNPETKMKIYNELKEILKRLTNLNFKPSALKEIYGAYRTTFKDTGGKYIPSHTELKTEILAWGAANPGKDNCVLNLLQKVFK